MIFSSTFHSLLDYTILYTCTSAPVVTRTRVMRAQFHNSCGDFRDGCRSGGGDFRDRSCGGRFARRPNSANRSIARVISCTVSYTHCVVCVSVYVANRISVKASAVAAFYRPKKSPCFFFFSFIPHHYFHFSSTAGHDYIAQVLRARLGTMQLLLSAAAAAVVHDRPYRIIIIYVIICQGVRVYLRENDNSSRETSKTLCGWSTAMPRGVYIEIRTTNIRRRRDDFAYA